MEETFSILIGKTLTLTLWSFTEAWTEAEQKQKNKDALFLISFNTPTCKCFLFLLPSVLPKLRNNLTRQYIPHKIKLYVYFFLLRLIFCAFHREIDFKIYSIVLSFLFRGYAAVSCRGQQYLCKLWGSFTKDLLFQGFSAMIAMTLIHYILSIFSSCKMFTWKEIWI